MQIHNRDMIFNTRQSPQVLEELRLNGRYVVKEDYIREKYTTITGHYAPLYRMLTSFARGKVFIPDGSLYPVWLSPEGTYTVPPDEDSVFLKLDIPDGFYILANNKTWDFMINHLYFPLDKEDELAHEAELARYSISSPSALVNGNAGNFYPLLKQKVLKSWERIYTLMPDDDNDIVGLCWELRQEWLI